MSLRSEIQPQTPAQSCCFPGLQYGHPVGEGAISLQNIVRPSALRLKAHLPEVRRQKTGRESHFIAKEVCCQRTVLMAKEVCCQRTILMAPVQGMVHLQISDTLRRYHPLDKPGMEHLLRVVRTAAYRLQVKGQVRLDLGHSLPSVGPVTREIYSTGL